MKTSGKLLLVGGGLVVAYFIFKKKPATPAAESKTSGGGGSGGGGFGGGSGGGGTSTPVPTGSDTGNGNIVVLPSNTAIVQQNDNPPANPNSGLQEVPSDKNTNQSGLTVDLGHSNLGSTTGSGSTIMGGSAIKLDTGEAPTEPANKVDNNMVTQYAPTEPADKKAGEQVSMQTVSGTISSPSAGAAVVSGGAKAGQGAGTVGDTSGVKITYGVDGRKRWGYSATGWKELKADKFWKTQWDE